ncbi:MAG: hypothetical protein QCH96_02380 [Candidatus Thermoplasmatota archaeon]|nr:hypothetical protein [Candidatus Thermoplasmatota archaeon]
MMKHRRTQVDNWLYYINNNKQQSRNQPRRNNSVLLKKLSINAQRKKIGF